MGQTILNMGEPPHQLYRAEQVRAIDTYAIQTLGVNSYGLMRKAARVALKALLEYWPNAKRLIFFCGVGNNGGDGYAMAAIARNQGLNVLVAVVGDTAKLSVDAKTAHSWAQESGCEFVALAQIVIEPSDVLIDAMLGTGQRSAPRKSIAAAIALVNTSGAGVCAVDVPAGLCANTGCCLGAEAVQANITVTFIGLKQGLFTNDGPAYAGTVVFDDLNIPSEAVAAQVSAAALVGIENYRRQLQPRWANSHKGHFGHVLVVGGNYGFGGAVQLAARAAVRAGAGLVSVATRAKHVGPILSSQPEIMAHTVASDRDILSLIDAATVIVVGPGLGRDDWAKQLLRKCLASGLPVLLDADGLNLVAEGEVDIANSNIVLTPHPGEAARMLGCSAAVIQADRYAAATALQAKYGGVCVLKGAGTIVASSNAQTVIPAGNAGMSAGGSGDVLSGIIGALIAQRYSLEHAASLGAFAHGLAGDLAAKHGQRGMVASDLIAYLRESINPQ